MKAEARKKLLEHFAALASDAESNAEPNVFLPVPEHARALRPEIVVIEGGRGAGKSELFNALKLFGDRLPALYGQAFPNGEWVEAFSTKGTGHPSVSVLDARAGQQSDEQLRSWWLHHLAVRLGARQGSTKPSPNDESDVAANAAYVDVVEREAAAQKRYVFAAYDYLDQLGALDPSIRRRYVKALLSLWVSLSNRYTWVRAKIFLRPDLFADGQTDFADASKLRTRAQSLQWKPDDLFRLAARHLANSGPDQDRARAWLKEEAHVSLTRGSFGWMPAEFDEDTRSSFAVALAGETMGAGARKGYTFRWITNHLQDGAGRIAPRSILRLLGFGAKHALRARVADAALVMTPQDLQGALEQTSKARAHELAEEHPLVARLEHLRGQHLLLERREAERLLERAGEKETAGLLPDGRQALDELERLGVLSVRADGRIDVPDIFRSGFGILRKGGTRRAL